ncbi:hypothetical protein PSPO01_05428 [Paraphaeosphaeria sporulosa]
MLEFHSVLGNTAMASLSTSTLGGLSLFSRCRCRGRRLELCRCGTTHLSGAPPNISGNTAISGAGTTFECLLPGTKSPRRTQGLLSGERLVRVAPAPWRSLNQC